eukprot:scaffold1151_cov152-Amphora_coffeaeformis.AAC.3
MGLVPPQQYNDVFSFRVPGDGQQKMARRIIHVRHTPFVVVLILTVAVGFRLARQVLPSPDRSSIVEEAWNGAPREDIEIVDPFPASDDLQPSLRLAPTLATLPNNTNSSVSQSTGPSSGKKNDTITENSNITSALNIRTTTIDDTNLPTNTSTTHQQRQQNQPNNVTDIAIPKATAPFPPVLEYVYYYSKERTDRMGMVFSDMLHAHSYVHKLNLDNRNKDMPQEAVYAGACGVQVDRNAMFQKVIDSVGLQDILRFACPPKNNTHDKNNTSSEANDQHKHIMLNDEQRAVLRRPDWLARVRSLHARRFNGTTSTASTSTTAKKTTEVANKNTEDGSVFRVVVHIRRGDVTPCNEWKHRYLSNAHYLRVLDEFVHNNKDINEKRAKVFIYSESESFESFRQFTDRNYTLMLDTDLTEAWKSIITADLFVHG